MSPRAKDREQVGEERLTHEEFKRLAAQAQERGESTAPLIKRLVLQTIDEVQEQLEGECSDEIVN
jgi:hypothetical protein